MQGNEIMELRKSLKLSRTDVSEATGLTLGRIAGIESNRRMEQDDVQSVIDFLQKINGGADGVDIDLTSVEAVDGDETFDEWNEIKHGDPITVQGLRGAFEFISYTRKANGAEHVSAIGGKGGRRLLRAFAPERVTAKKVKGKRTKKQEIAAE